MIVISEINFKALLLSHNLILLQYFFSIIIPIIVQNSLFTYLSLNSCYKIPIIIRLFEEVPKFILPVIIDSNWFIKGSFAIIKVLIIYYIFKYFIFNNQTIKYYPNLDMVLYPITIVFSILLVLFMLGLFTYKPIAIISNSMSPTLNRGDIVIYKKEKNINSSDIIVFKHENEIIVHRVVAINIILLKEMLIIQ